METGEWPELFPIWYSVYGCESYSRARTPSLSKSSPVEKTTTMQWKHRMKPSSRARSTWVRWRKYREACWPASSFQLPKLPLERGPANNLGMGPHGHHNC